MASLTRPTSAQVAEASRVLTSSPLIMAEAEAKWVLLLNLERDAEFGELAEAGVAKHTIDSLYPLDFESLVPGIIEFTTPEKYRVRASTAVWRELSVYPKNILDDWFAPRSAATDEAAIQFFSTDAFRALWTHLDACLPGDTSSAGERGQAMASALWYAYWGMLNLEKTPLWRSMNKAFLSTIDWVLPDLA